MSADKSLGLVGLGIMGSAIARNLLAAGYRVVGFDVDAARCREMADAGVTIAASAGAVATAATTILTSLPHDEALAQTARAVISAGAPARTIVEMSTLAIESKLAAERTLAEAGHTLLDCPLSGTGAQARTRDLTV